MHDTQPGEQKYPWRRLLAFDEVGVVVALFSVCVLLGVTAGQEFVQPGNLLQVARQASSYGIMAVGMVLLLSMGEVDLSVGAILTLVNIVTAVALREGVPMPLAVLLVWATGAACGLTNGLLGTLLRLPTIIVTLGTMSVFRGVALVLSKATPVSNFFKGQPAVRAGSQQRAGRADERLGDAANRTGGSRAIESYVVWLARAGHRQ
jgi:ribose transport system permease protein